ALCGEDILKGVEMGVLHPPIIWLHIPEGTTTLIPEDSDIKGGYLKQPMTYHVPEFFVSKYPISNAQYYQFIQSGGYKEQRWWTDAGWEDKSHIWVKNGHEWERVYQPRYQPHHWIDEKRIQLAYAGSLTWYEIIAFCNWLSEMTGETITLPTDQQWQRLEDDWRYPYRANPYGVMDMDYLTYYYTRTAFETGSNDIEGDRPRVLRGVSFHPDKSCDTRRNHCFPWDYSYGFGFYIVKSVHKS
ncbi:MAG: SUMF1/EgtB/PvdO family nonheme iron enzyme, partial [bacterium]|nr:SUMF1/EgtB/PvdO family nonheme iron enzyme [bacterium]